MTLMDNENNGKNTFLFKLTISKDIIAFRKYHSNMSVSNGHVTLKKESLQFHLRIIFILFENKIYPRKCPAIKSQILALICKPLREWW